LRQTTITAIIKSNDLGGVVSKPADSISPFWYRRLAEGTLLLGLALSLIYTVAKILGDEALPAIVPTQAVTVGSAAALLSLIARMFPRPKHIAIWTWGIFIANTAVIVALIVSTGGPDSPLGALWFLTALSTGVVGLAAVIALSAFTTAFMIFAIVVSWWSIPVEQLLIVYFASQLPLAVGFLFWKTGLFGDPTHEVNDETISHLSEKLSRESTKSEIIVKFIADGVMVIDNKGLVQLINPAAQKLTGWDEKEALQLDYHSVLKLSTSQDQDIQGEDPIQQVLRGNKTVVDNDLTLTTKSGKKDLLSLVVSPLGSTAGAVGTIAVFRDVTSEKAEEREKAEFVSTAAHEMRTPVATIEGYLALAMNPSVAQMDDKARTYLSKAHEATQHLGRLFQDLLTISKAEDGRLANNPQPIEINGFVQKLWEGQQPKAVAKGLEYVFGPQAQSVDANKVVKPIFYANVDPDRLSEVVNNLIDNSIKYTTQGKVTVDITAEPNTITISFQDSGVGIAKEDIPHLFQKFYRADNSFTREVGGTGLGLYICRRIMEQSNGQLWVESELGKGSTFFVQIPRIDSETAEKMRGEMAARAKVVPQAQAQTLPPTTNPAP
jgi:PAS domain S-box-containing protein